MRVGLKANQLFFTKSKYDKIALVASPFFYQPFESDPDDDPSDQDEESAAEESEIDTAKQPPSTTTTDDALIAQTQSLALN